MANQKIRIFAPHDDAVRNGSIRRVIYYPARLRQVSIFINGDFMNDLIERPVLKTVADCDFLCTQMLAEGEKEYTQKQFDQLAPACFH
jgi:hypothetical protein